MFASQIALHYRREITTVELSIAQATKNSSLTDHRVQVPEGYYTDERMKVTVVPNRNMMLLAAAGALAINRGVGSVAFAAHTGDHAIYPDCRPVFFEKMREVFLFCSEEPLNLEAPFIGISKAEIVKIGLALGVPFEKTWSCYKGGTLACGKCGTCVERLEAFSLNGAQDPTIYEARE